MDYELEWYLVTKSRIVWTLALGGYFFLLFFFSFRYAEAEQDAKMEQPLEDTQITIYKKQHAGMDRGIRDLR